MPVEAVQSDVGQQRGNDAPLWRALPRGLEHAILHHPGLEKFFDQIENVTVGDFGPQSCHNDAVGKVVKEPLDVGIEYVRVPGAMKFQDFFHGHVTVAAWPEPVRVVVKQPIEDRTTGGA